jgi:hypothetical protein
MFRKGKKRHSSSSSQSSEVSTKSKVGKWGLEQTHKAVRALLLSGIAWGRKLASPVVFDCVYLNIHFLHCVCFNIIWFSWRLCDGYLKVSVALVYEKQTF